MIDLHLHTTASDGSDTPEDLIRAAKKLGLRAVAVSDHDSVAGVDEALRAGAAEGVRVVPAVEMSTEADGSDIHFLGYFIDYNDADFRDRLDSLKKARFERATEIVERLRHLNLEIMMDKVMAEAGEGSVGRVHVARAMRTCGLVRTIKEAFERYLDRGRPAYVTKSMLEPVEVIESIHEVGGVVSLAHPGVNGADARIDEFIRYGLDAIEVYHPEHLRRQVKQFLRLATEKGLAVSGGSDSHGIQSTHGTTLGMMAVPDTVLVGLEERRPTRETKR